MGGACTNGASNGESSPEHNRHGMGHNNKKASRINGEEFKEEKSLQNGGSSHSSNSEEAGISSNASQKLKGRNFKDLKQPGMSKDFDGTKDKGKGIDVTKIKGKARSTKNIKTKEAIIKIDTTFRPSTSHSLVNKNDNINILCFEVANTIFQGSKLIESLSEDKIERSKDVLLRSEGVQNLISNDANELNCLSAFNKRRELNAFAGEIVRFGNRCKDPKFHNLDCFITTLESEPLPRDGLEEIATKAIKTLMDIVQFTYDLYVEMYLLRKSEQQYEKKCTEEENNIYSQKGERAKDVKKQMNNQRNCIKDLKKEALWSKKLEEIMEKLVHIVHFLHLKIPEAFIIEGEGNYIDRSLCNSETLGSVGLAFRYANIVIKMDNAVILHRSLPESIKEELYKSLPDNIKTALKAVLQLSNLHPQDYAVHKIRRKMKKILKWLLPMANNTIKAQQGFGWVGEMSNMRTDTDENDGTIHHDMIKLQTLEHANIEKTDQIILDLFVLLHFLVKSGIGRHNTSNGSGIHTSNGGRLVSICNHEIASSR